MKKTDEYMKRLLNSMDIKIIGHAFCYKYELRVDSTYQRDINARLIKAIKENFKEGLLGVLVVGLRDNGDKYVIDGSHRLAAIMEIENIQEVYCKLLKSDGPKQEAILFDILNGVKLTPSSYDIYKVNYVAGNPTDIGMTNLVGRYGYFFNKSRSLKGIRCVKKIRDLYCMNSVFLDNVLFVYHRLFPFDPVDKEVIRGLFWVEQLIQKNSGKSLRDGNYFKKLKMFSLRSMQLSIQDERNLLVSRSGCGVGESVCGKGILSLLNKYRKRKSRIED